MGRLPIRCTPGTLVQFFVVSFIWHDIIVFFKDYELVVYRPYMDHMGLQGFLRQPNIFDFVELLDLLEFLNYIIGATESKA